MLHTCTGESWLTGHLRERAQREREFAAWHAEHGEEREAQLTQLPRAEGTGFYWARAHSGDCRRPRWMLREGEQLDAGR